MRFKTSAEPTIGVEWEMQLIDPRTANLSEGITTVLESYRGSDSHVKAELLQNTVEVASGICPNASAAHRDLFPIVRELVRRCKNLDLQICGAGLHPFNTQLSHLTPLPRYEGMLAHAGILAQQMATYAVHVHVGVTSGSELNRAMVRLTPCLPVIIALSASSPFHQGNVTGFATFRQRILAADRSYGIPPSFSSWQQFCHFFAMARRVGMFSTYKDIHWDIRPRPDFGTIEIRAMDSQPTLSQVIQIAAFVHALTVYILSSTDAQLDAHLPQTLPWFLLKENCFRASKWGLQAICIIRRSGMSRRLREVASELISLVEPVATRLDPEGGRSLLESLRLRLPPYEELARTYARTRSFPAVVRHLTHELEGDLTRFPPSAGNTLPPYQLALPAV